MDVKMNSRVSTKNNAADPEKGFLIKSILKLCGRTRAMPTAWELFSLEIQFKLIHFTYSVCII